MEVQERQALWSKWATDFLKAKTEPMSVTLARVFMDVLMMEISGRGLPKTLINEFMDTFSYKIISKRAEFVGLTMSEPAKLFLCCLSNSPGTLVMYVYALRYWQITHGGQRVTATNLSNTFPMGFLPEAVLSDMWDAQKVELDDRTTNLLDTLGYKELDILKE